MKWFNLKENKCPQCNKDFYKGLETKFIKNELPIASLLLSGLEPIKEIKIFVHPCGFSISEGKFNQIVANMVEKDISNENYEHEYAHEIEYD